MKRFIIKLICLFIPSKTIKTKLRSLYRVKKVKEIKIRPEQHLGVINFGPTFGYNFKEYFIKKNMPEIIKNLKSGLDSKSMAVVDRKIDHFLNLPLMGTRYFEESRFLKRDVLYTPEEVEENNKFLASLPELKEKYKGDYDVMVPEVFRYHHGLKFLDSKIIDNLKGKTFIDLGAFYGDSAVVLNEYNPSKVISFEMTQVAEEKYYNNLNLNNIDTSKYEFVNKGAGEENFKVNASKDGMSNFNSEGSHEVEVVKLDDYLSKEENIGLIKMDIEGAEFQVIKGATSLIKKHKPLMLITIYHTPEQFFELKPYIESLGLDYKFEIRDLNFFRYHELETTLMCIPNN